jgi:LemA protein
MRTWGVFLYSRAMISIGWWIGAAVLLFWSVGAYNRLVRLRAEANTAFAALDAQWQRQLALIDASLPESAQPSQLTQPGEFMDDIALLWAALRGAAAQLGASLAAMRPRPLQAEAAAALGAAQDVLNTAWRRVQQDANDLAGSSLPDTVAAQWQQLAGETSTAQQQFNEAVARYNAAITQIPAVLLAWLFGFKRAGAV